MKKNKDKKTFDCLAYKEQAQKRILRETKGMNWEEEVRYLRKGALSGPFAELARSDASAMTSAAMAREKKTPYRTKS